MDAQNVGPLGRMSTYTTILSVFVTCLKLISNILSVYQRTCLFFQTSAYVGAIHCCVTGPLVTACKNVIENQDYQF